VKLIELLDKESDAPKGLIMFMAVISGVANGLLLAIINMSAEAASNNEVRTQDFFLYLLTFGLFFYSIRYAFTQATLAFEDIIRKVRVRITNKIRSSELLFIENAERGEMYTRLTQDSNLISQSAFTLITAGQSSMVLVFSLVYIAWLSPLSFFIIEVVSSFLTHIIY